MWSITYLHLTHEVPNFVGQQAQQGIQAVDF